MDICYAVLLVVGRKKSVKYMTTKSFILAPAVVLLCCTACSGRGRRERSPSQIEQRYAAWLTSLNDSVDSLQNLYNISEQRLAELRVNVDSSQQLYEVVADPVLVEKYRVPRGWRGYDSTRGTGILARLLEDGTVEVIATHSGAPFSSITLSCDGESISSATVPPDGSLNTTNGGVTRVAFNDALSLARFVADRVSKPVTLSFSGRGSIKLSDRQKKMMSDVAALPTALKEVNELERNMPVIYNKIQVFRNKIEEKEDQILLNDMHHSNWLSSPATGTNINPPIKEKQIYVYEEINFTGTGRMYHGWKCRGKGYCEQPVCTGAPVYRNRIANRR